MNSTLALKKADYEAEVGDFLGFGRGSAQGEEEWTTDKATKIRMDVASGLRRFYWCGHPWSFLKPLAALTLKDGDSTVDLPDDFGGIDNGARVTVTTSSNAYTTILGFVSPVIVKQAHSENQDAEGFPELIAQRPVKNMAPGRMQTSELYVYPTADQEYTLTFPYYFNPNYLTDVSPYVYGGIEHHEAILECCLAVAEMRRDGMVGVHAQEALRLLGVSIGMDKRKQPTRLGYNHDRSDEVYSDEYGRQVTTTGGVRINGTLYT